MPNVEVELKTIDEQVRYWCEEIDISRRRERDWRKDAQEALDLYDGTTEGEATSFNILYSNTETLAPSLFGAPPRPIVQRRFKDEDPMGRAVSQAGQRGLMFLIDTNSEEYETFDESIKTAVHDALLPGRGVTEFCYHAETTEVDGSPRLVTECVYPKSMVWNRFYHGYAKRWNDVPWCAAELYLDKDAVIREFGAEVADKMSYAYEGSESRDKNDEEAGNEAQKTQVKTACIYKIWDKKAREIVWVSPNHPTSILRKDEDELKLTGFYPFPKPLRFLYKGHDLMPTTLFKLYRTQAKELNVISKRLIHLIGACRVRGIYDSTIGEIEQVLKAEENDLIPAEQAGALQNTGGLEKAIWLLPIDKIITVIKELYMAREQAKRVIYEITGISDIIRGSSSPTETLGAQKIKEQWVTLRLKNMQKEVQRYVRDCLRVILEISSKRFQPETWAAMTGLPFTTPEERAQLEQIAAGEIQNAIASGQPPQPSQETAAKLAQPQWTQVVDAMRDDLQRRYRVDIETNSTLDVEANEDKELVAELMNAIAQFLNGVGPMVQEGILPFQAAQAMLLAVTKKFRFGEEIEEYIKQMQAPKPQDDGKAAEAQMKAQQEAARLQHDKETEARKQQSEAEGRAAKERSEMAKIMNDRAVREQELEEERQADLRRIAAEREAKLAELSAQRETERMKAQMSQDTELKKAAMAGAVQIEIAKITSEQQEAQSQRDAAVQAQANEQNAQAQAEQSAKQDKGTEKMADLMGKVLETQNKLLQAVAGPKEVVRDDKGKIKEIKPKKVAA